MELYGFAILRNGVKYDYPFRESLTSLKELTKEVYLALGDSEDNTDDVVTALGDFKTFQNPWDDAKRVGGLVLSDQTNFVLNKLREEKENESSWGFYLQCDELVHENEYQKIQEDITYAQNHGFDAVRFRYLHFWLSHNKIAINKKWYPQEIRAVKLQSKAESWGDAQSFRNVEKIYDSDAVIYHYGHVRNEKQYIQKKADILKMYHSEEKIGKYKKREKKQDGQTKVLDYFGPHPKLMKDRILALGDPWELPEVDDVCIVDNPEKYSEKFIQKIRAKKIHWAPSTGEGKSLGSKKMVVVHPSFWHNLIHPSKVKEKVESKLARPWVAEQLLTLKLSEQGVGVGS